MIILRRAFALVTTPIFYPNADPHIGHAFTMVLANAVALVLKNNAGPHLLTTGVDEHGTKIQRRAAELGVSPIQLCDKVSARFKALAQALQMNEDYFVRTTSSQHRQEVLQFVNSMNSQDIRKQVYQGWYCEAEQSFVSQKQLDHNRTTALGHPTVFAQQDNYVFQLSNYNSWLRTVVPNITSAQHGRELLESLDELKTVSISRPISRVSWGIPLPNDSQHVLYVWLDALINYHTAARSHPQRELLIQSMVHVIGKDIIKFHGLYWPAFLRSAKLPPPLQLVVHGHWKSQGRKMSKSLGNVVCPFQIIGKYGLLAVRLYFLVEGPVKGDRDFEQHLLVYLYNDFVQSCPNLLMRVTAPRLTSRPLRLTRQCSAAERQLIAECLGVASRMREERIRFQFKQVYLEFKRGLGLLNRFITVSEPWASSQDDRPHICYLVLQCVRLLSLAGTPLLPTYLEKIKKLAGGDVGAEFRAKASIEVCMKARSQCFLKQIK